MKTILFCITTTFFLLNANAQDDKKTAEKKLISNSNTNSGTGEAKKPEKKLIDVSTGKNKNGKTINPAPAEKSILKSK